MKEYRIYSDPPLAKYLFAKTKSAWLWLLVRLYVGWMWLSAGWGKVNSSAWVGEDAGLAMSGFVERALLRAAEASDVTAWYAWFLENIIANNTEIWSYLIAYGEVLVGAGLILGALTGIAAFFGVVMNMSFLLAGSVSSNPIMLILGIALVLAWKVSGYYGLDRFLLPQLGTPWQHAQKPTKEK